MRYLLKREDNLEGVLDQLTEAAFSVVSENLPEGRREDVRVGLYVALNHVLRTRLVCGPDCGELPACTSMRELSPLEPPLRESRSH